jgi:hypothetical protein
MLRPTVTILSLLAIGCTPSLASADVLLLRGGGEPVVGTIIRQDDERVVVRVPSGEGRTRDEIHRRTEIERIIETVSADRLARLDPARPEEYRDYAEELMARRADATARDTAIRLLVIAAWHDRERLARGTLLGMIALARSPEEEEKFRAAFYLVDPRATREVLKSSRIAATDDHAAAAELLQALRLLRTGRGPSARSIVEKPAVSKLLEGYSRILTRAEFNAASTQAVLSPSQLRQSLLLELEMESLVAPVAGEVSAPPALAWSRQLQGKGNAAVPTFDLESLTEFNPREALYRNGKWVEKK